MPFVNQMVVGFGKTPKEAPKYAGLIDSALIVTECEFATFLLARLGIREAIQHPPTEMNGLGRLLTDSIVIFAPVWGAASDRLGRKPLVILGLLGFALASVGMGLAQNLPQAITARCICEYSLSTCALRALAILMDLAGVLGAVGVLIRTVQFEITTSEHVGRGEYPHFIPVVLLMHCSPQALDALLGYRSGDR